MDKPLDHQHAEPAQGSFHEFQLQAIHKLPDHHPPEQVQGSIHEFKLQVAQETTDPWKRLDQSIPKTEHEWLETRKKNDFLTTAGIHAKIHRILNPPDKNLPGDLQQIVSIATSCVIWVIRGKQYAYDYLHSSLGKKVSEKTLNKYMAAVRSIIGILDDLCTEGLRHRVYEAAFLYGK